MEEQHLEPWALKALADASLERAAAQLRGVLATLADQLRPFPAFEGLATLQAMEIEPRGLRDPGRGCVVVCPDGGLYELTLSLMPGAPEVSDVDQVEELHPLELPPEEYILYAHAAIAALAARLEPGQPLH